MTKDAPNFDLMADLLRAKNGLDSAIEEANRAVEAVLRDNHAPRVHTYVLARNINSAHAWCRRNSVQPHSRDVTIATVGDRLRGYVLHDGDRAVFLDPDAGVLESWAVMAQNAEARGVTFARIADRP